MIDHAILSASGAHRWLVCTPSARLEATLPETPSEYAAEGTLAHKIAELKLSKHYTPMSKSTYTKRMNALKSDPLYQEEMQKHTDTYLEYVKGITMSFIQSPYTTIERRLDLSTYVPESFGTADCVIICGTILHVVDFKYGKGVPVSPTNNPQIRLYALGAAELYGMLYDIDNVCMHIVQPRLGYVDEDSMPLKTLQAWGETIKPIAQAAFRGDGEFVPGEHCRFCRAKAACRARANHYTSIADDFGIKQPDMLLPAEIGEILRRGQAIKNWVSDMEDYALSAILTGQQIPGWKAVEGRSNRVITDTDAAFRALINAGYDEALLYERKPITLTALEKLTGKDKLGELISGYIDKPKGKPTLAPETDSRPEYQINQTAAEDFGQN